MGALFFSLDPALVNALRRQLPLDVFVETGTYHADTTASVAPFFNRVYTVELSPTLCAQAAQKLSQFPHVRVIPGSSAEILRVLMPDCAASSTLFWLDAHWCGGDTGGASNECPVLAELAAIGKLNETSVVLIDDARYFLGPPSAPHDAAQWPGIAEVAAALHRLSDKHRLWVINDVIIYAPARAAGDVLAYARSNGVDLAVLAEAARGQLRNTEARLREENAVATDTRNPQEEQGALNSSLYGKNRSERVFAFHANRLAVRRLLDIGSNTGQFAMKMRRQGFDGIIYSVEPQTVAHRELRRNAQDDVRWIPLARQGAGRHPGRLVLNLSENSWSSSFFPVHENHLRAAPQTKVTGHELVSVAKTGDLLCDPVMREIDAVKIDVQGYELEVLEGLRNYIDGIRLILLEMSSVPCYVGAPDMLTLDRLLVQEFGFSRVTFESPFYDPQTGVAQQFDGIYAKYSPADRPRLVPPSEAFASIVTSIHGAPSRKAKSGMDVSSDWQDLCVQSWLELSDSIVSVSETAPKDPRVQWVRTAERPSITDLFAAMRIAEGTHTVLCNADVVLAEDLNRLGARLDSSTVYLGQRVEVQINENNPQMLDAGASYPWGFDAFLLPADFVRFVRESRPFPVEFRIGEPWWDYLIPLIALASGFPVKRLPLNQSLVLHHVHEKRYVPGAWLRLGEVFLAAVADLAARFPSHACDIFDDLAALPGPLNVKLQGASQMVCSSLP
jgi:FkbM family methyltransferase